MWGRVEFCGKNVKICFLGNLTPCVRQRRWDSKPQSWLLSSWIHPVSCLPLLEIRDCAFSCVTPLRVTTSSIEAILTELCCADWCMICWMTEQNLQQRRIDFHNEIQKRTSQLCRKPCFKKLTAQEPSIYSWKLIGPKVELALKLGTISVNSTISLQRDLIQACLCRRISCSLGRFNGLTILELEFFGW